MPNSATRADVLTIRLPPPAIMFGSRAHIPSHVLFRFTVMDPLPLLIAEVNRSVRSANDDAGDVAQPNDLSVPGQGRVGDALPVVMCVGTAAGVGDCSRGLFSSLYVGATTWAPARTGRIALSGPTPDPAPVAMKTSPSGESLMIESPELGLRGGSHVRDNLILALRKCGLRRNSKPDGQPVVGVHQADRDRQIG